MRREAPDLMSTSRLSFEDARAGLRFAAQLPRFLRRRMSAEETRGILRTRLERREADFLALVQRVIYNNPQSPYRELLALAGCQWEDVERLVRQEGIEGALRTLLRHGVYLTVDEFKGRRPVVRGSSVLQAGPGNLRPPGAGAHLSVQSGGSRGGGTRFFVDLAYVRDRAVDAALVFHALGGEHWAHGVWGTPSTGGVVMLLEFMAFGGAVARWFSQLDPASPTLGSRYRWSARALRWGSLCAGRPLPSIEHVALGDPTPILRWLANTRRRGRTPHLHTHASSVVRICQTALDEGIDLTGAQFTAASEPLTAARLGIIRRSGAQAWPQYSTTESGAIGRGCLAPEHPDEVHLHHDRLAMIQSETGDATSLPPHTVMLTSLRPTAAPLVLLNVSMGDVAEVTSRQCGCSLERLGWTTHLHTIRSFEKLTAGGMTFLDTDVIRVLEEVLPERFGGAPTHYQLVEQDAEDGQSQLRLLVHPAVGALDPAAVREAFLTGVSQGPGGQRLMGLVWRDADLLCVERRAPLATASGKILHLHVARGGPGADLGRGSSAGAPG